MEESHQNSVADPAETLNGAESASSASITSRAYARLKDDIISGALPPGSKLKIEKLRKTYNAGTSPIREALSLLTSDHLVERIDQRGFRVAPVSSTEFEELLKTRCWLEATALKESVLHGSAQWEESVILANYRLSRIPRSESRETFVASNMWEMAHKQFHMTLLAACGSSILRTYCDQLYNQNIRYRHLSGKSAYPSRNVSDEHTAICEAVSARDGDKAASLLVDHYRKTSEFVLQALKDQ